MLIYKVRDVVDMAVNDNPEVLEGDQKTVSSSGQEGQALRKWWGAPRGVPSSGCESSRPHRYIQRPRLDPTLPRNVCVRMIAEGD